MIVTEITKLSRKSDGKPYWKCTLEGSEYHLLVWDQPQFSEGEDIPEDKLEVKGKEGSEYYALKSSGSQKPAPAYRGRPPEETRSIEKQTKLDKAVKLYCQCTEQGTPLNEELLLKCYRLCSEIMAQDGGLVDEAIKLGAKVAR